MFIDRTKACQWTDERHDLIAKHNIPGDPMSWSCYTTEQGMHVGDRRNQTWTHTLHYEAGNA
jgi:hypothetical protein